MVLARLQKKANSLFWLPLGILAGGIIGAGVFSLPFVFSRSGLIIGTVLLAVAAFAYSVIHLLYGDIMLRTPGNHRFVGYARHYLGKPFYYLGVLMAVVQMLFVLTIYLILSVRFTDLILPDGTASEISKLLLFWLFGSVAIFLNIKKLALSETLVTIGIVAIIIVIFGFGIVQLPQLSQVPLVSSGSSLLFALPAILFALSGRVAIPSVLGYLKTKHPQPSSLHKAARRVLIWGTVIPAIAYALFVLGTLGLSPVPADDAVSGLLGLVPIFIIFLIGLLGWLSLWSSYLLVGLDVNNTLRYDIKMAHFSRVLVVVVAPLLLYFLGFNSFITLVTFVGGIILGLEGLLIIAMWIVANHREPIAPILLKTKKHGGLMIVLTIIFIAAIVSVFLNA